MLILGIDPGTATTGFGIVEVKKGKFSALDFGLIETDKNGSPAKRLKKIFFATNAKTAMRVGQAQGVMLFSAAQAKLEVVEYAPGTIKKVVAGDGRADKKMIQKALRKILGAGVRSRKRKKTHFDNEADALAVALCHAYHALGKIQNQKERR